MMKVQIPSQLIWPSSRWHFTFWLQKPRFIRDARVVGKVVSPLIQRESKHWQVNHASNIKWAYFHTRSYGLIISGGENNPSFAIVTQKLRNSLCDKFRLSVGWWIVPVLVSWRRKNKQDPLTMADNAQYKLWGPDELQKGNKLGVDLSFNRNLVELHTS